MKMKNNQKAFTLIELMVVMAVFLFIVGAAINIFISIIQHQKRVLAAQELLNQTSYAEEYMSKALRMAKREVEENCLLDSEGDSHPGYIYLLTRPDTEAGFYRGIKFINQSDNDACMEFFLDNEVPGDTSTPLVLKELKNSLDDSNAVALTSPNLQIKSIRFGVNGTTGCYGSGDDCPIGASKDDLGQPRVTVILNIKDQIIQTTVSQRNLNAK